MSGGNSDPAPQIVTQNTSNIPAYAQPYFQNILGQAQALSNTTSNPYVAYPEQRLAPLTSDQQTTNTNVMGMQAAPGYGPAQNIEQAAGLAALNTNYQPSSFTAPQVGPYTPAGVADVNAPTLSGYSNVTGSSYDPSNPAQQMKAAQSSYNPQLTTFQIGAPQNFGQDQANQYMSPYIQNVLDKTMQQNLRNAQQDQLAGNLNAGRLGTLGGSRQLIASTERERNLGNLQSTTEATGLQNAYENAQQQFERDRAAGLGVAGQNLASAQATQQLQTTTGMQMALANMSNEQQAAVQNQAAYLQTQGLNAQQAMQAALANQQAQLSTQQLGAQTGLQASLANQQSALTTQGLTSQNWMQAQLANQAAQAAAQQAAEQSRQFGANVGLQGEAQAAQAGTGLGALAGQAQAADLARYQAQSAVGSQQQQLNQQLLDQQYQDFLTQRAYPEQQLSYYSDILHGLPITPDTVQKTYGQQPSAVSQIAGLGVGALGLANLAGKVT
jgi:hypothetical protein